MLSSSFVENKLIDIDAGFPADKPSFVRDYDYDCDSDLESISEDDFEEEKSCDVVEQPAEECKVGTRCVWFRQRDRILTTRPSQTSGDSLADDSSQAKNTEPFPSNTVRLGHAILISGVAFSTWATKLRPVTWDWCRLFIAYDPWLPTWCWKNPHFYLWIHLASRASPTTLWRSISQGLSFVHRNQLIGRQTW